METLLVVFVCNTVAALGQPAFAAKVPPAWDVIQLHSYPVGILEENRVIAWRESAVLGFMDDPNTFPGRQEFVRRVHVSAASRTKAQVVKTGGILIEGWTIAAGRCPPNQDSGPASNAIDDVLAPDQRLHSQKMTEILPERNTALGVVHRKLNMRDPVDLYAQLLRSLSLIGPAWPARRARECSG